MKYSIITIWETYEMDSEYKYYKEHIAYFSSKEEAESINHYYEVRPREAIKIDNDIFLLANGVGYNKPVTIK